MNNFDQASSGIGLELTCEYDSDLARFWFEDSLQELYRDGGSLLNDRFSRVDVFLLKAGSTVEDFDLSDIDNYQFTKKDIINLLLDYYDSDLSVCKEDFNNTMTTSWSKATKPYLIEFVVNNISSYDYIEAFNKHFKLKAFVVSSRGYCQGDYIEAVIPFSVLDELGVNYKNKGFDIDSWLGDDLDNLVWNQPIYCTIEIDNEDHTLSNYLTNIYDYNEDELVNGLKDLLSEEKSFADDQKDYIINWFTENLPTQPDYN